MTFKYTEQSLRNPWSRVRDHRILFSRLLLILAFDYSACNMAVASNTEFTPQMFGAHADGVTDDTAAFQSALRAGPVHLPPGHYLVGDLKISDGGVISGDSGLLYSGTVLDAKDNKTILIAKPHSRRILDVEGSKNVVLAGFGLDGVNSGADCISAGSVFIEIARVTALRCDHALGSKDQPTAFDSYTHTATIISSEFADSKVGVANLIDSTMVGGAISGDEIGLLLQKGADANNFVSIRAEWCRAYNIVMSGATDEQFQGGMIDRGGRAGVYIRNSLHIQFTGVNFRRNGARDDDDSLGDSHLVLDGGNSGIILTGVVFVMGPDDNQNPPVTPRWGFTFNGSNDLVVVSSGDGAGAREGFSRGQRPARLRMHDFEGT